MKKPVLVQINCTPGGSTGKIMQSISRAAQNTGFESHMICAGGIRKLHGPEELHPLSYVIEQKLQRKLNKFTGMYGQGFPLATRQLLRMLEEFQPDIVQLHNLHHQFFDIGSLFCWLKEKQIPTFWTLHDCWAWTGHCGHYIANGCSEWKTGCRKCRFLKKYPAIYQDTAHALFVQKQGWYGSMPNLTLIAPSRWILEQKNQSFLRDTPTVLIHNGIDLDVFKPRTSGFRKKYDLENAFIVLGVSSEWTKEKGVDTFARMAGALPDTAKVVLVGGRKSQVSKLPSNILWIPRTESQKELAEIYSAADVFVNPTREDNFPTVNLEALACGTPVIVFPTGGAVECVDESCGIVLSQTSEAAILKAIEAIRTFNNRFTKEDCLRRASLFDNRKCMDSYIEHYQKAYGG